MNEQNKRVVFIFSGGRRDRLNENNKYAKDFFYGYFGIKDKHPLTKVIEIEHEKTFLLSFIDKFLRKLINFPVAFSSIFNKKLKYETENADVIVLVNESVMFYSLPYLYLLKKRNKDLKILLFTMGLFSKINERNKRKLLQLFVIKRMCLKIIDRFLFLGKGEYVFASKKFNIFEDKFKFTPFGIDTEFWGETQEYFPEKRKYILFIGNDLNRDYNFLITLIEELKEFNFVILSSQLDKDKVAFENVRLINGMWWQNILSDEEIKELYSNSFLTILPLINTLQPSGQSVALQSMATKTPVMITDTDGFWDRAKFENNENIFFIESNELNKWKVEISNLINNPNLLKKVSNNSFKLVMDFYNLDRFTDSIAESINLD